MTQTGTYIKALFLLVVFSMNTLVSFACSFGGFFHSLHHDQPSSEVALNAHHHPATSHNHKTEGMHHEHNSDGSGKQGDCCSERVFDNEKIDKSVARTIEVPKSFFLSCFLACFTSTVDKVVGNELKPDPKLVRWRILATIPDLRIVIQSFQI